MKLKWPLIVLLSSSLFILLAFVATEEGGLPKYHMEHIAVGTTDYDGTVEWYSTMLEMELVEEWQDEKAGIRFCYLQDKNGFRVEVIAAEESFTTPERPEGRLDHLYSKGFTQLAFITDDVDAMMEELENRGAFIFREAKDIHVIKRRIGMVLDNNGNLVELIELMEE